MNSVITPEKFYSTISSIPGIAGIIEVMHSDPNNTLVLYGGSVLDVLLGERVSNDLDFLLEYRGADLQQAHDRFMKLVSQAAARASGQLTVYENDHVVIHSVPNGVPVDIHYPASDVSLGLFRSESTVTGIGFNCRKREFFDPLGGRADLAQRRIVVHSPEYVISGPSAFPRLYRTALKLGTALPPDVVKLIRTFAPMVSIHDGSTNMRVLYETLKVFSHPGSHQTIIDMVEHGLFGQMFPEVLPLLQLGTVSADVLHSLQVNLRVIAASFDTNQYPGDLLSYLSDSPLPVENINRAGLLRFAVLFVGLGYAYYRLRPGSPYQRGTVGGDVGAFMVRMERNMLGFMISRFRQHPRTVKLLAPLVADVTYCSTRLLPKLYPSQTAAEGVHTTSLERRLLSLWMQRAGVIAHK